jgi:hypothetical protein
MRVTTLLQLTVIGLSGLASGFVAVSGVSGDQGSNPSYRININTLESNGGPQWYALPETQLRQLAGMKEERLILV